MAQILVLLQGIGQHSRCLWQNLILQLNSPSFILKMLDDIVRFALVPILTTYSCAQ